MLLSPVEGNIFMITFFFLVIPSVSGRRGEEAVCKLKYGLQILHALICNLLSRPLNF